MIPNAIANEETEEDRTSSNYTIQLEFLRIIEAIGLHLLTYSQIRIILNSRDSMYLNKEFAMNAYESYFT